jgi:nicotinamide riboside kinase
MAATIVALLGAESTGKTQLAFALGTALETALPGARIAVVPELLREWCEAAGRTPRRDEQRGLLEAHQARIEAAAREHLLVVADTTGAMVSTYSRLLWGDASLDEAAFGWHRRHVAVTLLTALDLPWIPDGLQRDGPQVRAPVDELLREALTRHGIGFAVIGGRGDTRLASAMAALGPLLRGLVKAWRTGGERAADGRPDTPRAPGRFSGALGAGRSERGAPRWRCECCVPGAEQALRRLAAAARGPATGADPSPAADPDPA